MARATPQSSDELRATGRIVFSLVSLVSRGRFASPKTSLASNMDAAPPGGDLGIKYSGQIQVTSVEDTPSVRCHREVSELVAELVEDRDWHLLAELMAEWDETRASCPQKRRLVYTAMDTVSETLRELYQLENLCQLPELELRGLKQDDDHYALSAIHAHLRIAQAWDAEGQNLHGAEGVRAKAFVSRAIQAITHLDPAGLNSPLLGSVHFALLPFLLHPKEKVARYYEARVHLDPEDLAPHYAMGRMLLPRWFGTYDQLEFLGRQAVAWTHRRMGAAAYAALYLGALSTDPAPLKSLDPELFEEGIEDLICFRRQDPSHVPQVIEALWDLANLDFLEGMNAAEQLAWDKRCARMGELAKDITRGYLTAVHAPSWRDGLAGAKTFVARAMLSDLEAGRRVNVTSTGLQSMGPA